MVEKKYCPNCGLEFDKRLNVCPNCGYIFDKKGVSNPTNRRSNLFVVIVCSLVTVMIILLGIATFIYTNPLNNKSNTYNEPLKSKNTSIKKSDNVNIEGSYQDDADGAAITLNSDHTGRYVYADPVNSDTNDQLAWKKNSDGTYSITLQDSNVNGSLTGKLDGNKLTLSSNTDSNWNNEDFTKVKGNLNLDKFLADKHSGTNKSEQHQAKISDDEYALAAFLKLQGQSAAELKSDTANMHWNQNGNKFTVNFGAHSTLMAVNSDDVAVTYDEVEGDHMGSGNGHKIYSKQELIKIIHDQKSDIDSILSSH